MAKAKMLEGQLRTDVKKIDVPELVDAISMRLDTDEAASENAKARLKIKELTPSVKVATQFFVNGKYIIEPTVSEVGDHKVKGGRRQANRIKLPAAG